MLENRGSTMERGVRITIAATILLIGATGAVLARRDAADNARPELASDEPLILRAPVSSCPTGVPPRIEPAGIAPQPATGRQSGPAVTVPATASPAVAAAPATPRMDRSWGGVTLPPARDAQRPVRHRVVDGDTLAMLAQRYLGSAERQMEIFEANRDLLASPDLLPIGAMLRIPPAQPVAMPERPLVPVQP